VGESPDRLTLAEREQYEGWWIALEVYTPETLPLRAIEALAPSAEDCVGMLLKRELDPSCFEFIQLRRN